MHVHKHVPRVASVTMLSVSTLDPGKSRMTLQVRGAEKVANLKGHVIVCGAEESFYNFVEQLRRCDPLRPPVVILHPRLPKHFAALQQMFQPLHYVQVLQLSNTMLAFAMS